MVKTVAFHNLGCKVNSYEMEIMIRNLAKCGFTIVPFEQRADIYIINTCTVTNIADRKSRQMIHRARGMNKDALIIAAGCYVNTHDEESVKAEGVDICVSNKDKKDIALIINRFLDHRDGVSGPKTEETPADPAMDPTADPTTDPTADPATDPTADPTTYPATDPATDPADTSGALHTRCFLKVQDGCDQFCTYCIIPYARGRISSKSVSEAADEVAQYVNMGYSEFILTGIHLSSYGKDRKEAGEGLLDLIYAVSDIEGVRRLRLGSLEPRIVDKDFAKALAGVEQICPHFHLSLQSGSDTVLKRMNRHYDTEDFMQSITALRDSFDHPALTTDIIVGFPGETEEEFSQTVSFVEAADFYETHVFKYSRRAGTVADRMEGQLSEELKHQRSGILLDIGRRHKADFEDRYIRENRKAEVLFEDTEEIGGIKHIVGYTREYIKAAADPDKYAPGEIAAGALRKGAFGEVLFEG